MCYTGFCLCHYNSVLVVIIKRYCCKKKIENGVTLTSTAPVGDGNDASNTVQFDSLVVSGNIHCDIVTYILS